MKMKIGDLYYYDMLGVMKRPQTTHVILLKKKKFGKVVVFDIVNNNIFITKSKLLVPTYPDDKIPAHIVRRVNPILSLDSTDYDILNIIYNELSKKGGDNPTDKFMIEGLSIVLSKLSLMIKNEKLESACSDIRKHESNVLTNSLLDISLINNLIDEFKEQSQQSKTKNAFNMPAIHEVMVEYGATSSEMYKALSENISPTVLSLKGKDKMKRLAISKDDIIAEMKAKSNSMYNNMVDMYNEHDDMSIYVYLLSIDSSTGLIKASLLTPDDDTPEDIYDTLYGVLEDHDFKPLFDCGLLCISECEDVDDEED